MKLNSPFRWSQALKKAGLSLSIIISLAGFNHSAHAELIQLNYTHLPTSTPVQAGHDTRLISPSGGLELVLAGGIDRKLRMSVLRNGQVLHSRQSAKLLGATDVIHIDGKGYYAERFTVPKLSDGAYLIRSEILSSTNSVISSKTSELIVDTSSPVAGTFSSNPNTWGNPVHTGPLWKLGTGGTEARNLILRGFSDPNGIQNIKARVFRQSGQLYKEYNVHFSETNREGSIGYKSGFFPRSDLDEVFEVDFVVTDNAGNLAATPRQRVMFDDIGNEPAFPFAVYDPDVSTAIVPGLTGFVPYTPGMSVKTNPVRLSYKIPKSNWHTYREGGLSFVNSFGENRILAEDAGHVYLVASFPFGSEDNNYIRFVNFGAWSGTSNITYDLSLHSSAPKSPTISSVDYLFSDIGWRHYIGRVVAPSSMPVTVTRIRFTVEARPYDQIATHHGTCTVPAGKTQCEIAVNLPIKKGTSGRLHNQAVLKSKDGALSAKGQWADVFWNDYHYPSITYDYDQKNMILLMKVNQPSEGAYHNWLRHTGAWIENEKGQKLNLNGKLIAKVMGQFEYEFDLKMLPEGLHDLYAVAGENLSGQTKTKLFSFRSDRTAPAVKIINTGGKSIDTLDKLSFSVTDNADPEPNITSILLTGGPAKESISLPARKTGINTYGFEYPILFPSMSEGEIYTLSVTAQDRQFNIGKSAVSFMYSPMMVGVEDDDVRTPAVAVRFDRNNGTPLINSEQLLLADGSPVSGTYDLIATLRSDAVTPFTISGVEIKPGETQMLGQLNFTSTGGRIDIAAIPVDPGVQGSSGLIISTSAPNAPVVYTTIETWLPRSSLTVNDSNPIQSMTVVEARVSPLQGNSCPLTSSSSVARSGDPVASPICLIEWTKVPHGMATWDVEDSELPMTMLRGRPLNAGPQEIEYSISLYTRHGDKIRLTSVSKTLNSVSPSESVRFGSTLDGHSITRVLDTPVLSMEQKGGIACDITGNRANARSIALSGGPLTCLIEFTDIPAELAVVSDQPLIRSGVFKRAGNFPLNWRASLFNGVGQEVIIEQGSSMVRVVHPAVHTGATLTVNESSSAELVTVESIQEAWGEKTYSVDRQPHKGEVVATGTGFVYTPEKAYVGEDTFTYRVTDESGMVAVGEASVTVEQFNYPPTATRVLVQTRESEVSDPHKPVINDINLWDTHALLVLEQPANGRVDVHGDQFVLTPEPGFYGDDHFTYQVTDMAGEQVSGAGNVYVSQFNVPPSGVHPGSISVYQGVRRSITLTVYDINIRDQHRLEVIQAPATVSAQITGSSISIHGSRAGEFQIIVRATDQDGLFVDQVVDVNVLQRPPADNQIRSEAPIVSATVK